MMVLVALMYLVAFGAWKGLLAPWVTFPDDIDHGWERTAELHRLADGAAGTFMVALSAGALILAVRPRGRSALAAWTGAALAVSGGFSWLSALIQGHDGVGGQAVFSAAWVAIIALVFLVLHPEGRAIARGGAPDAAGTRPGGWVRTALAVTVGCAAAAALAAALWRASGGVFESPLEDDVFSLVYLGGLLALGAWLARAGREGWRPLTAIVLASAAYAVVGGVMIALT
ncbi:hypothetical protein [Demequina sp. NBRC 110056]|uniref:hypothetical protein n=1 Tax=Demequina sp. NBRC 110056 TaxID=1570345 RepID=UPI0013566216|nr:hypothetical protein [Demequina sp. NBRC 110056]